MYRKKEKNDVAWNSSSSHFSAQIKLIENLKKNCDELI